MDTALKKRTVQKNDDFNILCEWDLVPSRSTLKLFHANTRLKEAQRDFIVKRQNGRQYTDKENLYSWAEWQEMEQNKKELRRHFWEANNAIIDNKDSLKRFIRKIKEFLGAQISVQNEINNNKLEIKKYSEAKEKMEKYIKLYSELFTSYLEKVAQQSSEFNSVQGILNRYMILENCRHECSQLLKNELNESLELRRQMMTLVEEKSSRLKILYNSLALFRVRQKKATEKRVNSNNKVINLEQEISSRLEESVTLKGGCYSFYEAICKKRKMKPTIAKEDTKNQMHCIEKSIFFYKEVLSLASALQQYQRQDVQTGSSVNKRSIAKSVLDQLINKSTSNIMNYKESS